MDRPRIGPQGPGHGLAGQSPRFPQVLEGRVTGVEALPGIRPVDTLLIDGLVGVGATKAEGSIRRKDQQRHATPGRLDDGGKEVGRGGTRRGDHGCGVARGLPDAEREEARRSLVQVDPGGEAGVHGARHHQWRGAGARSHAHVLEADPSQLIHESSCPGGRDRRIAHCAPLAARARRTDSNLMLVSSHSRPGSEPATMPAPANSRH